MVSSYMFGQLYKPRGWGDFAEAMSQLLTGNGTTIYDQTRVEVERDGQKDASTAYSCVSRFSVGLVARLISHAHLVV